MLIKKLIYLKHKNKWISLSSIYLKINKLLWTIAKDQSIIDLEEAGKLSTKPQLLKLTTKKIIRNINLHKVRRSMTIAQKLRGATYFT